MKPRVFKDYIEDGDRVYYAWGNSLCTAPHPKWEHAMYCVGMRLAERNSNA